MTKENKTYEDYIKDARNCKDYRKCVLCHGCRNYSTNNYRCTKCSIFPKLVCEHSEEEIVKGFELIHKEQRPKIEIGGGEASE